ncbi:P-loop containing nucleoside triphosphate hydrolase protein [Punctularia strigosozonata HHB-11173 SS5]|uniref:P-loop containing nucleoside triphosphate hydrolase protein n=1 Tax=Punctularia strigosozonata (strain HHB-11173) TaxID=741275 RepID=UPI0004417D37|nr:P-loop containing nucleoside triphosphate hydrolase protein [Punctularia strigosozonata HHB-11173 SS5]EIN07978.1 P-loop containing nucleoside triphosphate hydrolase protein [Punctularia strigosozonata HHB-11173 SS5]
MSDAYLAYLLLVPCGLAALSAIHLVITSTLFPKPSESHTRPSDAPLNGTPRVRLVLKVLRAIGGLYLVAFAFSSLYGRRLPLMVRVETCAFYVYAALLALGSLAGVHGLKRAVELHVSALYLAAFLVYAYADGSQLVLVDGSLPAFPALGRLIVLFFLGVFIPLALPGDSSSDPLRRASLWSLLTWGYMDGIVLYASRHDDLPLEKLLPLQQGDAAELLSAKGLPKIDPLQSKSKRHVFWSLMEIFKWDYIKMFFLNLVLAASMFLAPIGIQNLLEYLENGDARSNATIRPWVWIVWVALGPLVRSFCMEWYLHYSQRTVTRAEAIITQLVFQNSLRLRLSAGVGAKSGHVKVLSSDETSEAASESESTVTAASILADSDDVTTVGEEVIEAADNELVDADAASRTVKQHDEAGKQLAGRINNLVTSDLSNMAGGADFMLLLRSALPLIGSTIYLYRLLGSSALVGAAVLVLTLPVPTWVAKVHIRSQREKMSASDRRVQVVTQTMSVLRMIKLFAWEDRSERKIDDVREQELGWIRFGRLLGLIDYFIGFLPLLQVMAIFGTYVLVMKQDLAPSLVFTFIAVFSILSGQIWNLMGILPLIMNGKVSLDRLNEFLHETDLLSPPSSSSLAEATQPANEVVGISNATFTWNGISATDGNPRKRGFKLIVKEEVVFDSGTINLIVGPTGSGKTSLLLALLGEMNYHPDGPRSWYHLSRDGGVAYAAQETWILNDTIRENIIFGSPLDQDRYNQVLEQCALKQDLAMFAGGDLTEVGEKGLNLSGGQKARITLARAIYSKAKILLLDDILAALDVHTGKWVVEKCLKGVLLRDRTVLFVTHNLALTQSLAKKVIRINNGVVAEERSLESAVEHDASLRAELLKSQKLVQKAEAVDEKPDVSEGGEDQSIAGKLVVTEEVSHGQVGLSAIMLYLGNLGGTFFWIARVITALGKSGFYIYQPFFLGLWASQYEVRPADQVPDKLYLAGYAGVVFASLFFGATGDALWIYGGIRASRRIHRSLVASVLSSTFRWLDTVPNARVITRFTKDLSSIDQMIGSIFSWQISIGTNIVLMFVAITYIVGWRAAVAGLFVIVSAMGVGRIWVKGQRVIKREQSVARSPVLSLFDAALEGLPSIRAYNAQEQFTRLLMIRIDNYTRLSRNLYSVNRWVDVRIDAIGSVFSAVVAAGIVYGKVIDVASAGFALNQVLAFAVEVFWFARTINMAEVECTSLSALHVRLLTIVRSLERIRDFIDIDHEPPSSDDGIPPAYWPASGSLHVSGLSARYSRDSTDVLKDLSFDIRSGERVGVVGRTGAGKSTIALALLRAIVTSGEVFYDGIEIHKINLDKLRSNITLIPQHPDLLAGTLRENLDPFGENDDTTLIEALRAAGLSRIQREGDPAALTLDSEVAAGGANVSHGQRQIIALARAHVRGTKLVIMDEATAAIDYETDAAIQESIRNTLKGDVTLITIAHRLRTIMDYDKIMVLDAGRLIEFGSPKQLLAEKKGLFYDLVENSHDRETLYGMIK